MEADVEWIFFAVGVAVIGVIGIALGLVLGRAVARRAARREGVESDSFMTPIGPPPSDDGDRAGEEAAPAGGGSAHAGDDAANPGDPMPAADDRSPDDVVPDAGARDDARD
jgi:hypothetical protein